MKKISFIIIIFIFSTCLNKKDKIILNSKFKSVLISYIKETPIKDQLEIFDDKISYPSYHLFFEQKNMDTILAIKLLPHLASFNLINFMTNIDSAQIFSKITPIGYFFIDKNPIIIFDSNNYSKNIFNKKELKQKIPDSLKFTTNKINMHLKSKTKYYKVTGDTLIDIELDIIKHK
ncbi:MAG: hypothetical protein L3J23_04070 [Flavobacteriaceae bacterium]|nr:hypothetical protein [Flavobacteriaceae bacterium]